MKNQNNNELNHRINEWKVEIRRWLCTVLPIILIITTLIFVISWYIDPLLMLSAAVGLVCMILISGPQTFGYPKKPTLYDVKADEILRKKS